MSEEARANREQKLMDDVATFVSKLMPDMVENARSEKNRISGVCIPNTHTFKPALIKYLDELSKLDKKPDDEYEYVYEVKDAVAIGCVDIYWKKRRKGEDKSN
jgi:hypothetical protein